MTQPERHWLDEGRHGPTPAEVAAAIASHPDQPTPARHGHPTPFRERLAELAHLEDGWLDGYGKAPSTDVLSMVGNVCAALGIRGSVLVAPTEAGGVNLEWCDTNGGHELEIMPDLSVFLMTVEPEETS